MMNKNSCEFMGKLVSRPKIQYTENGEVARASILINRKDKENPNIINIIAFGQTAQVLYNRGYGGAGIYTECRVESTGKNISGQNVIIPTFVVSKFNLFSSPKSFNQESNEESQED